MKVVLSDEVHKNIEKLYDRRIYLTDKSFCQSFVSYCNKMANDFSILESGRNTYIIRGGYRISTLSTIQVSYRIVPSVNSIIVYSIGFIGLRHLYRLCSYERRVKAKTLGRRPPNITASSSISDYKDIPNGYGGEIRGLPVKIVLRKGVKSSSGKPLFNYLWNGKIISKIDFLSCNPFEIVDDNEKATAYGANGRKYWIMPSGRRLLYCSRQRLKEIIIEWRIKQVIKECVITALNETIRRNIK